MDMLTLASLEEYRNLPRDKWGIPSLPSDGVGGRENPLCDGADANGREGKGEGKAETGGLDLVIVPGVAFGVDGRRLGHGKGYYDTWIERYARVWGQVPVLGMLQLYSSSLWLVWEFHMVELMDYAFY